MAKITALIVLSLLLVGVAQAGEKTLTWTPPTQCEDGSEIGSETCGPLIEYRLQCNNRGTGAPYNDYEWRKPAPSTEDTRDYPPGDYWCRLSVNNADGWSKWSVDEATFSSAAPQSNPNPPTDLAVTGDLTAYTIIQSRDRVALLAVGTVAPGTQCDGEQPVMGKYVVPVDSVTWSGSVRSEVVLGNCG